MFPFPEKSLSPPPCFLALVAAASRRSSSAVKSDDAWLIKCSGEVANAEVFGFCSALSQSVSAAMEEIPRVVAAKDAN